MEKNKFLIFIVVIGLYSCNGNTKKESMTNLVNQSDNKEANLNKSLVNDTMISVIACPATGESSEPKISTDGVWSSAEQMPQYPGGEKALMNYIKENLKYPTISVENGVQGQVIVRFVVDKKGNIKDVLVLRSIEAACDKEAVRVVKSLPKRWIPGKQNGKVVDVYYALPVRFKIEGDIL